MMFRFWSILYFLFPMASLHWLVAKLWKLSPIGCMALALAGSAGPVCAQMISEEPIVVPPPALNVSVPDVQELLNLRMPTPSFPAAVTPPNSAWTVLQTVGLSTTQLFVQQSSGGSVPPVVSPTYALPEQVQALVERNGTVFPPEAE